MSSKGYDRGYGGGGGHRGDGYGRGYRGVGGHRGNRGGGDRGRGGYGRVGGDVFEVKRNVRQLCETPINKSLKIKKHLIKKPSKGVIGKPIELIANHYRLVLKNVTYFHYDIDIKLGNDSGNGFQAIAGPKERKMRKLVQRENTELIEKLAKEWNEVFGNKCYVFDGQKNLYTKERLRISDSKQVSKQIKISFDGFREQTYEVSVQFTNEVHMSSINDFYDGKLDNCPEDAFQVLEIILRFIPTQTRIPVGKSLFTKDNQINIKENALMAFGHYQSVNQTEVGPTLVVNRSCTLFRTSGTLIEFLKGLLNNRNDLNIPFTQDLVSKLSKQLSGLKIFTTHIGGKRNFTIDCLTSMKPNECFFEMNNTSDSTKKKTNVMQYFKETYNKSLKHTNIPCILLKGGHNRYLPVEMCEVVSDQPMPRKHITSNMTSEMIRRSGQQKAIQRFSFIQESAETVEKESRELLNEMGIQMITKPIKLDARVMNKPECSGSDRRVIDPKSLSDWFFVNFSPKVKNEMNTKAKEFIHKLKEVGKGMGIDIKLPIPINCDNYNQINIEKCFINAKNMNKNLQIIVFCVPEVSFHDVYFDIKYLGDIKYGIISQCILDKNLLNTPSGYYSNLLLKINGKLGGKNVSILDAEKVFNTSKLKFPIMKSKAMIIGADVTHPAPADRMLSSVAACIGSYDKDFSKYSASISVQRKSRDEMITQFDVMITELVEEFRKQNNFLPNNLIIFRDGVSNGQFDQVMEHEYSLLLEAFRKLDANHKPKVTFIIVQKRHHTRFLPFNESDAAGNAGNVPAGTVVDHTITDPVLHEYYLCSHFGPIGTSRPAKYVVLHDDNNMTADDIEKLSYYLCYTYIRCVKSISIPTPVMYAHLAAKRAKHHIIAQVKDFEEKIKKETKEEREEREARIASDLNNKVKVNELLKMSLYYT